jgi:Holliday junction resolvase RusA-like endonuclease
MTLALTVEVFGTPESQGSVRGFVRGGRAILTSDNKALRPWREAVTWAARDAMESREWVRVDGPVRVTMSFWLPRPKNRPKTRDVLPTKGKDVDKMVRSIFDSLTNAGVWVDDAQVCAGEFTKRYVVGPDLPKIYRPDFHRTAPGVVIRIETMDED